MKVQELEGAELDAAVAKAAGWRGVSASEINEAFFPSSNWADGGPIIERERIDVGPKGEAWTAHAGRGFATGPTPLIAAMRAYVAAAIRRGSV